MQTIRALIADKEAEMAHLEAELSAARAYIEALENRLKEAETRIDEAPGDTDDPIVAIRRVILEAGQPLFIDDIVRGLGRRVSRESREHIRRLVLPWVRRGEIFTRPRPLMYGLLELESKRA